MAAARLYGWRAVHFRPALQRSGNWSTPFSGDGGFPDLVLAKEGKLLFIECKSGKDKLRPDQEAWRDALIMAGADWRLWTREGWQRGEYDSALGIV